MGVRVVLADREPIGAALRRLKRLLANQQVARELRRRRHFIPPTQLRRAKRFKKQLKAREETLLAQMAGEQPVGSISEAAEQFWKRAGKP